MGKVWTVCSIALAASLLVGCGGGPAVVPVSGVVTLDGEPLPEAAVTFQPTAQSGASDGSYGKTDAQGRYALKLVTNDSEGAVLGKHRVMISLVKPSTDDSPSMETGLPTRYNSQSELTFDVPAGGSDAANFDLESK